LAAVDIRKPFTIKELWILVRSPWMLASSVLFVLPPSWCCFVAAAFATNTPTSAPLAPAVPSSPSG
jgi:hypothetical protein